MVNVVLVLSLIFALIVAIFAVQNNTPVDIAFLGWKYSGISLVLVILGSAASGAIAVFLFGLVRQFKMQRDLRSSKSQNTKLSSQISALEAKIAATESVGMAKTEANGVPAGQGAATSRGDSTVAAAGEPAAQPCNDNQSETTGK